MLDDTSSITTEDPPLISSPISEPYMDKPSEPIPDPYNEPNLLFDQILSVEKLRMIGPTSPQAHGTSERGAVIVILTIAVLLSVVAVALGLRGNAWVDKFLFFPPEIVASLPEFVAPTEMPPLKRAPTVDGIVLNLLPRPQTDALTLQEIYKKVSPSIVAIESDTAQGTATGSGILMSTEGYLITNEHVIQSSGLVRVILTDGRSFEALLVGSDVNTDLAVLKIEAPDLIPAEFGSSDDMVVGDAVAAIGNPLGTELRGTMTDGILSAVSRNLEVGGYKMSLLQTTAALNSGNSGGALVNDHGQVIGVTNMKLVTQGFSTPVEGLGFAIPTTVTKTVTDALIQLGHVTGRPMLGITVRQANPTELEAESVDHGLTVQEVTSGSDAEKQGLRVGDLLITAQSIPLYSNNDLLEAKNDLLAGDMLELTLLRDGISHTIQIRLMEQYELRPNS